MNKEQFLEELTDVLQLEDAINESTNLKELEEWDSMAHLGVISMFDIEFSKNITNAELKNIETVSDLMALAGL
ncbi:TPA: acyl carrier protein [Vibrio vulnificus]|uniref:Acyl carrier protein n=1 Tax=Vibrio alfacsensis TaxID=1074311 RepID=A0ABN5PFY1_9VIBR|nr:MULTISPECIES: acyl carrier protein [Vibrio]AXY02127.1 acyl carrier protein [Vibrio alfacsensis]CAE6881562.1 Acyl carrier protein [Vibrio sp. B1REV9]CAE6964688.1 Acyl carrier protein [Vibrio sp. B1REV9]HAS8519798.1 acyl carrier protein [Vibrio vulnificus]